MQQRGFRRDVARRRRCGARRPAPCSAPHRLRSGCRRASPGRAGTRRSAGRTACARARSAGCRAISRSATPTQTAAMCRRPRSSTFIAVLKPWPSRAADEASAGTRNPRRSRRRYARPAGPSSCRSCRARGPGVPRFDDEGRDAARAVLAGSVRAITVNMPASRRIGDVALGAVEDVVVAVAPRRGLQRGGVGAGFRLGQGERADDLAGRQPRQVARLLLRRCRP